MERRRKGGIGSLILQFSEKLYVLFFFFSKKWNWRDLFPSVGEVIWIVIDYFSCKNEDWLQTFPSCRGVRKLCRSSHDIKNRNRFHEETKIRDKIICRNTGNVVSSWPLPGCCSIPGRRDFRNWIEGNYCCFLDRLNKCKTAGTSKVIKTFRNRFGGKTLVLLRRRVWA